MEKTVEEITRQINGLEELKKRIPQFDWLGVDNHAIINAQVAILKKEKDYPAFRDAEYDIELAAYSAFQWLYLGETEDLF